MLEARARQRASSKALSGCWIFLTPTARVVTDDGEKRSLAEVQPGMTLRLTTGDRVPVDGDITQGEAPV